MRHAGVFVPLFSLTSSRSWGVGEFPDLVPMARWLRHAGMNLIQVLPLNEMAPGLHSPYSAISAMALDPVFIRIADVEDFAGLDDGQAKALLELRATPRIEYARVRELKMRALRAAFDRFVEREWRTGSSRAQALGKYVDGERWWIDRYSVFRALHVEAGEQSWVTWPPELQRLEQPALDAARDRLAMEILFRQYLQWIAASQWQAARAAAGVLVLGDVPFTVDRDSADVWGAQQWFHPDASVGVPPDAFSDTGQRWGLPAYRWDVLEAADYPWLRDRARRAAALFDGYRIDHVVGFYRTYTIPDILDSGAAPIFMPADEAAQLALGERLMTIFRESAAHTIAEDLGTVPAFVRQSLTRLGIPGYRVCRWEREWDQEGQPFRDPGAYPALSVATSGTHDTETMAAWWDSSPVEERGAIARLPTVDAVLASRGMDASALSGPFNDAVRDVLLEALVGSGSDYVILPLQDLFGWPDRINVPATIDEANWTWRLPIPVDRLDRDPEWRARAATLKSWAMAHARLE